MQFKNYYQNKGKVITIHQSVMESYMENYGCMNKEKDLSSNLPTSTSFSSKKYKLSSKNQMKKVGENREKSENSRKMLQMVC